MIFAVVHRRTIILAAFGIGLAGFIGWKLLDWDEVKW